MLGFIKIILQLVSLDILNFIPYSLTFTYIGEILYDPQEHTDYNIEHPDRSDSWFCLIAICFIGFAACFGLAAVADLFATIYYGEAFSICGPFIISMCPLILIIGLGEAVRNSFIYPMQKDTTMVKILMVNAVINLILSYLLIPILGIYGAVIGMIDAETFGMIAEFIVCKKYISWSGTLRNGLSFAIIGMIMDVIVRLVAYFTGPSIMGIFIQIAVGAFIYLSLSFIYGSFFNNLMRENFLDILAWVKKIIKKLKYGNFLITQIAES